MQPQEMNSEAIADFNRGGVGLETSLTVNNLTHWVDRQKYVPNLDTSPEFIFWQFAEIWENPSRENSPGSLRPTYVVDNRGHSSRTLGTRPCVVIHIERIHPPALGGRYHRGVDSGDSGTKAVVISAAGGLTFGRISRSH